MFKGIKKVVGKRFNLKTWVGYDNLKNQAGVIKDMYEDVSPIKERQRIKAKKQNLSFEEMMQLNQMTDADIQDRIRSEKKMFIGYVLFAVLPLAYAGYIFSLGMVLGGIVSFLASMLVVAYAFRSQVYIYQLSHRQLSVNFMDVLKDLFKK
jgi:hypothetical protein